MVPYTVILTYFLYLFTAPSPQGTTTLYKEVIYVPEIEIKSFVSDDNSEVKLEIALPQSHHVGFELYNKGEVILHYWHAQTLSEGKHRISLPLPTLTKGAYTLHILIGDEVFRHLVVVQ